MVQRVDTQMRCALVSGASGGIGKACAIQLAADHGMHILVNYATNREGALETCRIIEDNGGSAEPLGFQVQSRSEVHHILGGWMKDNHNKTIHTLINNAGIAKDSWFMWMNENDWDDVIGVSLKGMYNVTQAVMRQMMIHKSGRIINISSLSGIKGIPGQSNYSAAKAGMIGASKALAQELGRMNITVNTVAPGFVNTAMTRNPETEKYIGMIPLGRMAEPEEIAYLVSFLASDRAAYITGETISINGGIHT